MSTQDWMAAVSERYNAAAVRPEGGLCCPRGYDPKYMDVIPREVIDKDYGCGDPTPYIAEGDIVLDLGSGSGKLCFVAAQIVGPRGRVIGVDASAQMVELARSAAGEVADRLGYHNVDFYLGCIEELWLNTDELTEWLQKRPVIGIEHYFELEAFKDQIANRRPLISSESVTLVISNCVLNLVRPSRRNALFAEIARVLKPGGRIAISDIVSDEPVPQELRGDPDLASGCIGGAFQEGELLDALERAGFYGLRIAKWDTQPWRVIKGIEFRSVTVTGRKAPEGPCYETGQAVCYRGPWKQVEDDDGHVLRRGERTAVCEKSYNVLTAAPYDLDVMPIPCQVRQQSDSSIEFDCSRTAPRHPRETKGSGYEVTTLSADSCCPGNGVKC